MKIPGRKSFAGVVAATLAAACLGFAAGGAHKSSERGTNVTFDVTMKFRNGDTLPAGTYRMEVPENSQSPDVAFYKDGKVMTTVHAKLVTEEKKNSDTEVDYIQQGDSQLLTEIRPGGWHEALVFGSTGQGSANTAQ